MAQAALHHVERHAFSQASVMRPAVFFAAAVAVGVLILSCMSWRSWRAFALAVFGGTVRVISSKADRYACPHYQEMGCLLDAFEKTCEEGEDMSELLGMHGTESVWMCCCPMPYQKCRKEDRSRSCDLAFRDIILPLGTRDVNKTLLRSSLLEVRGRHWAQRT